MTCTCRCVDGSIRLARLCLDSALKNLEVAETQPTHVPLLRHLPPQYRVPVDGLRSLGCEWLAEEVYSAQSSAVSG